MLFNHKFPDADVGEQDDKLILRNRKSGQCSCCGQLTHWTIAFLSTWCCSEECSRSIWNHYYLRRRNSG